MSESLLPPNATAAERAIEGAARRAESVPLPARDMWNPDKCPAALLPWLAWAFSVDEWDTEWTEAEKRSVIRASLSVHKIKGTIGAIERALAPLGYLIDVVEWWEMEPRGVPYTFSIVMGTGSKPVSAELYEKAERIVLANKNLRSHLIGLTIKTEVPGEIFAAAALVDGAETTILPYSISNRQVTGVVYFASCMQDAVGASVYPENYDPAASEIIAANEHVYSYVNYKLPLDLK
jgi:phage tail P2-like protein